MKSKFTKREIEILEVLVNSDKPLSAIDIQIRLKETYCQYILSKLRDLILRGYVFKPKYARYSIVSEKRKELVEMKK